MRIRALTNGNVIEAHPDAAKQLIEAGIYEAVGDDVPQTSEVRNNSTAPASVTAPAPKRRRKKQ